VVSQQSSFSPILLSLTFFLPQKITACPHKKPKTNKQTNKRERRNILSSKVKSRNIKRGILVLQNSEIQATGAFLFATWNTGRKIHGMHRICLAKTQESKVATS